MNDREKILGAVKDALDLLPSRKPLPDWNPEITVSRAVEAVSTADDAEAVFVSQLSAVNGKVAKGWAGLVEFFKENPVSLGYCDPQWIEQVRECIPNVTWEDHFDRSKVDAYEVGITPASIGVAETGTIILKDRETRSRLSALAPWIHVAILSRQNIVGTVKEAVSQFDSDPSIVMVTGPSKTADIEGILIEGVHGPGIQVCCLV